MKDTNVPVESVGKSWKDVEAGFFKDKRFRDSFFSSEPDSAIVLVRIRLDARLTQKALAKKMKTKQESIARAEARGCSLTFLKRAAFATGKYLEVTIKDIPKYGN